MPIPPHIVALRKKVGHDLLVVPAVSALIFNDAGEILLQRAAWNGQWCLVGGVLDPGEQPADAAAREALEETGLIVEPVALTELVMEPTLTYPNGDRVDYLVAGIVCRVVGGTLKISDEESLELKWFKPADAPPLFAPHQARLDHALTGGIVSLQFSGHRLDSAKRS